VGVGVTPAKNSFGNPPRILQVPSLSRGTMWTSAALMAALVALIAYQGVQVRRDPLDPLPAPTHRRTGAPQRPNGQLVRAFA
jgi:hypothetical protein